MEFVCSARSATSSEQSTTGVHTSWSQVYSYTCAVFTSLVHTETHVSSIGSSVWLLWPLPSSLDTPAICLPWDSLAYGAAVIGINLNSSPLVGKYIATLLFGGSSLNTTNGHSDVLHSRVYSPCDCDNVDHHSLVYCLGTRHCGAALIKRREKKWD